MRILQTPAIDQLEKDIHVAGILKRCEERSEKIADIKSGLATIDILETEAVVNGEEMILFSVDGVKEGVAITKKQIDSGEMTREDAYLALSDVVEQ